MRNLTIAYDLHEPGQGYDDVIEIIKKLGFWAHPQRSVWYVRSEFSAAVARDAIAQVMDKGDTLLVVDSTSNEIAWHNLEPEVARFYRDYWTRRSAA